MSRHEQYSFLKELQDDKFLELCRNWRLFKIAFYGIGTVITFIYVVIKCAIDKLS